MLIFSPRLPHFHPQLQKHFHPEDLFHVAPRIGPDCLESLSVLPDHDGLM